MKTYRALLEAARAVSGKPKRTILLSFFLKIVIAVVLLVAAFSVASRAQGVALLIVPY